MSNSAWKVRRIKRVFIPEKFRNTSSPWRHNHMRMGCWNNNMDFSGMCWTQFKVPNMSARESNGIEVRLKLKDINDGETIPESLIRYLSYGFSSYPPHNPNPDSNNFAWCGWQNGRGEHKYPYGYSYMWHPKKDNGSVIYKFTGWYLDSYAFEFRGRKRDLFADDYYNAAGRSNTGVTNPAGQAPGHSCYNNFHFVYNNNWYIVSNLMFGPGVITGENGNLVDFVESTEIHWVNHSLSQYLERTIDSVQRFSRGMDALDLKTLGITGWNVPAQHIWHCWNTVLAANNDVMIAVRKMGNYAVASSIADLRGTPWTKKEFFQGSHQHFRMDAAPMWKNKNCDCWWWNPVDINNNNILVWNAHGGVAFLRINPMSKIKAGASIFAAKKITESIPSSNVGTQTYTNTPWRNAHFENFKNAPATNFMNNCHSFPTINDHNIAVMGEWTNWFAVCKYNSVDDKIEDAEAIKFGNDLEHTGIRINNNNQCVVPCFRKGFVDVYELEYMNEGKYGYGLGNLNNKNNTNQPMTIASLINEEDKIEEPFCSEILINTNLENINIICSPRELYDSELVLLDGSNLAKSAEPYLYNIFGDRYNTEHTPTDYFSLPNLSGRYIVGNKEKEENNKYSTSEQALQAFSLETEHYFGFSPKENIIKKYYKSKEKESNNITSDINSERIIKNITINTNNRNNRLSTTIDDKCYLFYIKRRL